MRNPYWEELLVDYIEAHQDTPFMWGTHDCCSFAVGAVKAITGDEPKLPAYSNEEEAQAQLRNLGGLVPVWCALLGQMTSPKYAATGDVVLFDNDGASAIGVCTGDKIVALAQEGLIRVPMNRARICWKVS